MEYAQYTQIPEKDVLMGIFKLHESIFGDSKSLCNRMEKKSGLLINVALDGTKVVGYKIGYQLTKENFYSWLGGVHENYRNFGVASKLLGNQHTFLKENGYKIVQTKTKNKWRKMLILNINNGFDVMDTYTDKNGETKIILEKNLLD
ncbi:GNAT family N-acetyltransferase [Lederbergia citrea]|uniref:GNAT family N-acetyltransferase n=1 Tax=Lederbergia citrea TaxID=2833581 RepID=UPI001BC9AA83|nr:GNAT family N-acetyltransferase [Lederbergia citrea]MBS4177475.1 GNAT family N-acetyltransferase [Lederbergia citrea]